MFNDEYCHRSMQYIRSILQNSLTHCRISSQNMLTVGTLNYSADLYIKKRTGIIMNSYMKSVIVWKQFLYT